MADRFAPPPEEKQIIKYKMPKRSRFWTLNKRYERNKREIEAGRMDAPVSKGILLQQKRKRKELVLKRKLELAAKKKRGEEACVVVDREHFNHVLSRRLGDQMEATQRMRRITKTLREVVLTSHDGSSAVEDLEKRIRRVRVATSKLGTHHTLTSAQKVEEELALDAFDPAVPCELCGRMFVREVLVKHRRRCALSRFAHVRDKPQPPPKKGYKSLVHKNTLSPGHAAAAAAKKRMADEKAAKEKAERDAKEATETARLTSWYREGNLQMRGGGRVDGTGGGLPKWQKRYVRLLDEELADHEREGGKMTGSLDLTMVRKVENKSSKGKHVVELQRMVEVGSKLDAPAVYLKFENDEVRDLWTGAIKHNMAAMKARADKAKAEAADNGEAERKAKAEREQFDALLRKAAEKKELGLKTKDPVPVLCVLCGQRAVPERLEQAARAEGNDPIDLGDGESGTPAEHRAKALRVLYAHEQECADRFEGLRLEAEENAQNPDYLAEHYTPPSQHTFTSPSKGS